jgi:hypothetical protein
LKRKNVPESGMLMFAAGLSEERKKKEKDNLLLLSKE